MQSETQDSRQLYTVYHRRRQFAVSRITQYVCSVCSLKFVCVTLIIGEIQEQREFMLCLSLSPISAVTLRSDRKQGIRARNLTGVKRKKIKATPTEVVHLLIAMYVLQV